MKTSLVRIGNSRGIRIPKTILEQCRLSETVELEVEKDRLVIRPARKPRSGWEDAFRLMAQQGDDALLDRESLTSTRWDRTEWEW
ncbi:MAG: AbrB/MazE/SpoVT family DNA-binding domain-containing protein [Candidatus Binatia bacterium]